MKTISLDSLNSNSVLSGFIGEASAFIADDFATFGFAASDVLDKRGMGQIAFPFPFYARPAASIALRSADPHQIPLCYRSGSNNPAMPSAVTLRETGNAYPSDPSIVEKLPVSSKAYEINRSIVYLAHVIFARMIENPDADFNASALFDDASLFSDASALKGKPITQNLSAHASRFAYGIFDTLRDLEVCGLVYCVNGQNGRREMKKHSFRVNPWVVEHVRAQRVLSND